MLLHGTVCYQLSSFKWGTLKLEIEKCKLATCRACCVYAEEFLSMLYDIHSEREKVRGAGSCPHLLFHW